MSDAFLGDRLTYAQGELDLHDLMEDPMAQLRAWLDDARMDNVIEPNAMCLSTVDSSGQPSSRMVLLRAVSEVGLEFFTNYRSRKGMDIAQNSRVAVNFWWATLERQIRVEGVVEFATKERSDAYFASRPYGSQVASAASPQSQPITDREELESLVRSLEAEYPESVPRPEHWGGYVIRPTRFEFWQGRPSRMHDRFVYELVSDRWVIQRLAP